MADQRIPYPGTLEPGETEGGATLLEKLHSCVITVDHKRLGILFVYSLFFLLVGGAEAICIRIQLARPDNHFLEPAVFNRFSTMHGTTMVLPHYIIPPGGLEGSKVQLKARACCSSMVRL